MNINRLKPVFFAFLLAVILKLFIFDLIIAQGHSMEPSIKSGTVLVVSRLRYGFKMPFRKKYIVRWAEPKAGEVVVFYTPIGELAVKRCTENRGGEGFFVKGDNEAVSYDSRAYGLVPPDNIIGKVLGR